MKKVIALIFLIIFIISAAIFLVLLNLRITTGSATKIKTIAAESGVYDSAAAYIKDKIVTQNNIKLDQGDAFEKLNSEVNAGTVNASVNDAIDQIFNIIENKAGDSARFTVGFENKDLGYTFYKTATFEDSPWVALYQKSWSIIAIAGLIALIPLVLMIICLKDLRSRLNWSGLSLVILSLLILVGFFLAKYYAADQFNSLVRNTQFFSDPKLVNGMVKFAVGLLNHQSSLLYMESGAFLIIGFLLLLASGTLKTEIASKIDALFFNEPTKIDIFKK